MDVFRALSFGAKFNKKKNEEVINLFKGTGNYRKFTFIDQNVTLELQVNRKSQ